jgi:hypothetical protein
LKQIELTGKLKMASGYLTRRLWHTCTRQQEINRSWLDLVWIGTGRGKVSGLLKEECWPFILVDKLFSVSTSFEGITLDASEVAPGATGMGVNRIDEVVDRVSEEQAPGMYRTSFTARSLTRVGGRDGMWGSEIKVGSDKELMKVEQMVERY